MKSLGQVWAAAQRTPLRVAQGEKQPGSEAFPGVSFCT